MTTSSHLLPIPPYRLRLFTIGVGERVREGASKGQSEAQVFAAVARERGAIAAAIESEPFRDAFARAYAQAHNALLPNAPVSDALARHATDEIVKNRANDARWLAQLVTRTEFQQAARTAPAKPATYALPPEKIDEMVARFTAEGSRFGIDARIHNQQSMEGHRIGHLALVQTFADNGPLHSPLVDALRAQLPEMNDADLSRLANDWLEARRQPAQATSDQLVESGHVYQQVMQRSDATRIAATKAQADAAALPHLAPVTTAALLSTTALQPTRRDERSKSEQQKAEDVIYTLNHALTCLSITDTVVAPAIGAMSEKWFGKRVELCGHDHGPGESHHDMAAEQRANELRPLWKRASDWIIGEAVGDVGAVGFTIGVQRMFPGFMDGIRHVLEPVLGWAFRSGANRAAVSWGEKNGLEKNDPAIADRAKELYQYEMKHLPQMAVWTVSSVGINYATMWGMNKYRTHKTGMEGDFNIWKFTKGKSLGAATTAAIVMGTRAIAPNGAHSWDQSAGKHVIVPLTKILGKPFGVRTEDVDKFNEKRSGEDTPLHEGRVVDTQPRTEAAIA